MFKYFLFPLLLSGFFASSQVIPVYNVHVYDSTLTGYFFLSSFNFRNSQPVPITSQLILDGKGDVVFYKTFPANSFTVDFKIQPNGKISYYDDTKFYILDSTFSLIDSVSCPGYETDPHDLQILNTGNFLLLGDEYDTINLSTYHYFNHNGSIGSDSAIVQSQVVLILDSNKNILFDWHTKNYFQFGDVYPFWLDDPLHVDWTHCNAVEMDIDGNILLSIRHFNEITKINTTTKNIMWRMGGKNNQYTFYNDSVPFCGQHDIRRAHNGNITLFDNGMFNASHAARGIEYSLDEINKTATLVWNYSCASNVSSLATGNMQRINDNLRLVDFGVLTNGAICFSLVDSTNNELFQLSFPDSSFSYRAFYYPTLPWTLNRPVINCFQQGNLFYLQPSGNFNSYLWSTGDTTPVVQVTDTGRYFVFVPYGEGFIKSSVFNVNDVNDPCNTTGIPEFELLFPEISVYPNPATKYFSVHFTSKLNSVFTLSILDPAGKILFTKQWNHFNEVADFKVNIESLSPGIYFLELGVENYTHTTLLFVNK
jgi:hypothetical protein